MSDTTEMPTNESCNIIGKAIGDIGNSKFGQMASKVVPAAIALFAGAKLIQNTGGFTLGKGLLLLGAVNVAYRLPKIAEGVSNGFSSGGTTKEKLMNSVANTFNVLTRPAGLANTNINMGADMCD